MLTAKSLSCRRGQRLVFRDLGFTLEKGGLLLVTGRNGAGKSSLLRILAGLLPPYEGGFSWAGEVVTDLAIHRQRLQHIGHLDAVKPELTVSETVRYWCALNSAPMNDTCLDFFGLLSLRETPARYLSAGQKRRLALTRLILRPASLWLLDEPSTALDNHGQELLSQLITQHRASGGMVVIATHHASDYAHAQNLVLDSM